MVVTGASRPSTSSRDSWAPASASAPTRRSSTCLNPRWQGKTLFGDDGPRRHDGHRSLPRLLCGERPRPVASLSDSSACPTPRPSAPASSLQQPDCHAAPGKQFYGGICFQPPSNRGMTPVGLVSQSSVPSPGSVWIHLPDQGLNRPAPLQSLQGRTAASGNSRALWQP